MLILLLLHHAPPEQLYIVILMMFWRIVHEKDGAFDNPRGGVRHSSCFDQKQPPGVVVVSTFVAGYNPQGCRGCHLDCQAILVRTTPSDTTLEGLDCYQCVI